MKKYFAVSLLFIASLAHAGLARLSYHYVVQPGGKVVVKATRVVAKTPKVAVNGAKKSAKVAEKVLY